MVSNLPPSGSNERKLNFLILHPSGAFGGAGKSLVELWNALPDPKPNAHVITPKGTSAAAFAKVGMKVCMVAGLSQFNNTWYGYYRGLRWLVALRDLALFPFSIAALWRLRGQHFGVVHANEITLLPIALIAKRLFGARLVVHVRSLQAADKTPWRSRWVNGLLARHADAVIAIDDTVARSLPAHLPLHVIRNGLHHKAALLPVAQNKPLRIGALGVLVKHKGFIELIEAMHLLQKRGIDVECVIGGDNIRAPRGLKGWVYRRLGVASDLRAELEEMIERFDLRARVRLLGFVEDVQGFYEKIDVICFPAHLNAAGRPIFEGALFGRPCVVAITNPPKDSVIHGETGFAIAEPDPVAIADAIEAYARDPEMTRRMGQNACTWAEEYFSIEKSGREFAALYHSLDLPDEAAGNPSYKI